MALHERAWSAVLRDPVFNFVAEMANEALNRPGGRITERGTHDELLALGGRYAAMQQHAAAMGSP